MANYFEQLNAVNVGDHIEKKNGLSYISWAWAWAEVKKRYPDSTYQIYERPDGCIYWTDGNTCWVKTGLTVNGIEHIEYLPVMDFRNQSIKLDKVTSTDVNKTIKRSLTKACALHGLGLYIYAGEDLPEASQSEAQDSPQTDKKKQSIKQPTEEKKPVETPRSASQPDLNRTISDKQVLTLQMMCKRHNNMPPHLIYGKYGRTKLQEMTLADWEDFSKTGQEMLAAWDRKHVA